MKNFEANAVPLRTIKRGDIISESLSSNWFKVESIKKFKDSEGKLFYKFSGRSGVFENGKWLVNLWDESFERKDGKLVTRWS